MIGQEDEAAEGGNKVPERARPLMSAVRTHHVRVSRSDGSGLLPQSYDAGGAPER